MALCWLFLISERDCVETEVLIEYMDCLQEKVGGEWEGWLNNVK